MSRKSRKKVEGVWRGRGGVEGEDGRSGRIKEKRINGNAI